MADAEGEFSKRHGTRVFKKSSPNGKVRFQIEGVVLVDESYVKNRRVFVHVLAAFRYGREDLDVLGLSFRKDLFLASAQLYPPQQPFLDGTKRRSPSSYEEENSAEPESTPTDLKPLTRLQERLIKKLGSSAYPFYFELPFATPASVTLQPGPSDSGKPCGVDYELRAYIAEECDEKPQSRSSVRMAIRKLTYAPEESVPQPSAEIIKDFIMSPGTLRLEVSLDKEVPIFRLKYYHGEYIAVNVLVDNNSNKTVKKIKVSVIQVADIMLFSRAVYKCTVDEAEFEEGCPILPSQTGWCKVYHMCPLLSNNREKRGLALDGKLKNEDTNLASSTIILNPTQKENLGIIVQYRVRVRLALGFGASDVSVELPFTLAHPKPPPEEIEADCGSAIVPSSFLAKQGTVEGEPDQTEGEQIGREVKITAGVATGDFIDLEDPPSGKRQAGFFPLTITTFFPSDLATSLVNIGFVSQAVDLPSDDLIFEDFARLRLRGQDSTAGAGEETVASSSSILAIEDTHQPIAVVAATTNVAPTVSTASAVPTPSH
ncbi:Beta-arrestin-1 [Echinococcus granulosus]|uniref:Beta-arrestin-1 n=1 Tax=Echinococcus granulosus TaxID=6210 RepID=W6UPC6_ECHGR|nr:Beta-arrestin-1 [Echinococcus granulosus]EUB63500.1 Beta-arrestin-1 [Echinococcus granulosus]